GDVSGGLSVAFRSPHGLAQAENPLEVRTPHDFAEIAWVVRRCDIDVCVETGSRYGGLRGCRQVGVVFVGADDLRGQPACGERLFQTLEPPEVPAGVTLVPPADVVDGEIVIRLGARDPLHDV